MMIMIAIVVAMINAIVWKTI